MKNIELFSVIYIFKEQLKSDTAVDERVDTSHIHLYGDPKIVIRQSPYLHLGSTSVFGHSVLNMFSSGFRSHMLSGSLMSLE